MYKWVGYIWEAALSGQTWRLTGGIERDLQEQETRRMCQERSGLVKALREHGFEIHYEGSGRYPREFVISPDGEQLTGPQAVAKLNEMVNVQETRAS